MAEPMSDGRLAEIRRWRDLADEVAGKPGGTTGWWIDIAARDLLAEVDRLRAVSAPTPDLVAEVDRLRAENAELRRPRLGGAFTGRGPVLAAGVGGVPAEPQPSGGDLADRASQYLAAYRDAGAVPQDRKADHVFDRCECGAGRPGVPEDRKQ